MSRNTIIVMKFFIWNILQLTLCIQKTDLSDILVPYINVSTTGNIIPTCYMLDKTSLQR
jgi:hypothetical protein